MPTRSRCKRIALLAAIPAPAHAPHCMLFDGKPCREHKFDRTVQRSLKRLLISLWWCTSPTWVLNLLDCLFDCSAQCKALGFHALRPFQEEHLAARSQNHNQPVGDNGWTRHPGLHWRPHS